MTSLITAWMKQPSSRSCLQLRMSQYSFLICSAPIGRGIRKCGQSHGTAVSHSLHCALGAAYSTRKLLASFLTMVQMRMPKIIATSCIASSSFVDSSSLASPSLQSLDPNLSARTIGHRTFFDVLYSRCNTSSNGLRYSTSCHTPPFPWHINSVFQI